MTATGCPIGCWLANVARTPPCTRCPGWDGTWLTAVVTAVGVDARGRAALRLMLQHARFAELREGVWLRPDNLADDIPAKPTDGSACCTPVTIPPLNWPPRSGTSRAGADRPPASPRHGAASGVPERFAVAAAMVRHLLTDPVLPAELLPEVGLGSAACAYADFAA